MAQTKIKAGLFEGIIGNGTDGYFLMSNGDGTMTWSSVVINPTITNVDYPGTVTAADPAGGETITLTGTGFKTGATVTVGGTSAPSVSYVSETQITFTTPAKTAGDYDVVVTNTDTGSATFINGISFNGIPAWTTAAGSLGTFASGATISTITLQATEPDAGTITFNITNGALPTGLSLTGANIDGTTSILNADTLYTFTVTATDDENQATPRTFTITVKKEFISSENFTINTYTGNGSTQSIEGKIGTAALFNGVNPNGSVIDLPDLKPFFTQKQTVSLSMWFNAEVVTTDNTYLFSDYNSTSYNIFAYLNTSGILVVSNRMNGTTNNFISSSAYNDSQWYHLVITNDATSRVVTVYINGSSIGTNNISANGWSTGSLGKLGIGAFYSTTNSRWQQSLKGKIDQVRIFDRVLSSSEVTTLYGESNTSTTKSTTDIFADGSGVALYEFEKGAIDTGGTNGYIGSAGVFDGSGYIDISNSSSLVANKSAISISTWVMFDNLNTQNFIFYNFESGGSYMNFGFYDYGNGTIYFQPDATSSANRGYISNSGLYSTNEWVHIAMVFDGSATGNANRLKVYINNSQVTLTFDGTIPTTTGAADVDIRLGGRANSISSKFNGKLDQIRVFDKAISSSEVTTLYGETSASATKSTTDIFDDGSGVALYEFEGNANDTGGVSGKFGSAGIFNGSSSKIVVSDSSDNLNFSNHTGTISAWVNLDSISGGEEPVVNKRDTGNPGNRSYLFNVTNGVVNWYTYNTDSNSQQVSSNTTLSASQWHHIVVTLDQTNIKIYIDGTLDKTASSTYTSIQDDGADFTIGYRGSNSGHVYFDGKIDDVRIYSDVLTSTEVGYLYNNTTASIPTDNLEAYYKLDGNSTDEQGSYDGTDTDISYGYDGTATNVSYAYDGTPTDVSFVGTLFQPDLVWVKSRSNTNNHNLFDSIRGATYRLVSNLTNAQDANGQLSSFNSNGFTVGPLGGDANQSGTDMVAWCWKAASSDSTNTDGSITSTIRANQDAGFSIVKYTGNNTASATVGHGLSSAPELVIIKNINTATDWQVFGSTLFDRMQLNNTGSDDGNYPLTYSATTITLPSITNDAWNNNGNNFIAYCFHSIDGYQKIGSYTGTGSTQIITGLGFAPRFVMIKNTGDVGSWIMHDKVRFPNNPSSGHLRANTNGIEDTGTGERINFDSDGFTITGTGQNVNHVDGDTYIYLAIA